MATGGSSIGGVTIDSVGVGSGVTKLDSTGAGSVGAGVSSACAGPRVNNTTAAAAAAVVKTLAENTLHPFTATLRIAGQRVNVGLHVDQFFCRCAGSDEVIERRERRSRT